jgi:hypothetical protein
MGGDDAAAALEARKRARQASPDAIAFLVHCIRDDRASLTQHVRSSTVVLECAGLLQTESRPTGLFGSGDAGDADVDGRETG